MFKFVFYGLTKSFQKKFICKYCPNVKRSTHSHFPLVKQFMSHDFFKKKQQDYEENINDIFFSDKHG